MNESVRRSDHADGRLTIAGAGMRSERESAIQLSTLSLRPLPPRTGLTATARMLSTQPSSSLPFPSSLDRAARIISLKSIKNSIIGKRERKLELLRAGRATLCAVSLYFSTKTHIHLFPRLLDMVKKIIKSLNHGSVDQESAAELVEIITVLGALSLCPFVLRPRSALR